MGRIESKNETVFVALSTNRTGMSVCSNVLSVSELFPAGTRRALQTTSSGCFFYVPILATSLSKSVNRCTLSKQETPRFQRFATFRSLTTPLGVRVMGIVPNRFEHIHLLVNRQANVLFKRGQVFVSAERHYDPLIKSFGIKR